MTAPMISYAQNAEDVVLARLFRERTTGCYVDVGAGDPVDGSVTKHFYDRGWRGVNIEPLAREHALLCRERPADVNLALALSGEPGRVVLYEGPEQNRGASTLSEKIASRYAGQDFHPVIVEGTTLSQVCRDHTAGAIDFLKIDVEGHEVAVIAGGDWERFRPRVVVVEATEPNSAAPSHEAWEHLLLSAGYRCALFDGLNRFYASADDAEALSVLSAPANVHDEFEPWRWVHEVEALRHELDESKRYIADLERSRERAEAYAKSLERSREEAVAYAESLERAPRGRRG